MSSVSVIIPLRVDSSERLEAAEWVAGRWCDTLWEVVVAKDTDSNGPWCKARSIQDGVDMTSGDLLVIADADCWCDPNAVRHAINHIDNWARWSVPHRRVMRLDLAYTKLLISDASDGCEITFEEQPYTALAAAGGIVVLTRELWNRVPMDPRFLGWGFEDVAWWAALRALDGPAWRGKADILHLWHPRIGISADRTERSMERTANFELNEQYLKARRNLPAMAELIREAKSCLAAGRGAPRAEPDTARRTS